MVILARKNTCLESLYQTSYYEVPTLQRVGYVCVLSFQIMDLAGQIGAFCRWGNKQENRPNESSYSGYFLPLSGRLGIRTSLLLMKYYPLFGSITSRNWCIRYSGGLYLLYVGFSVLFMLLFIHCEWSLEELNSLSLILIGFIGLIIHGYCWAYYFKPRLDTYILYVSYRVQELTELMKRSYLCVLHILLHLLTRYAWTEKGYNCILSHVGSPEKCRKAKNNDGFKSSDSDDLLKQQVVMTAVWFFVQYAEILVTNNQAKQNLSVAIVKLKVARIYRDSFWSRTNTLVSQVLFLQKYRSIFSANS